MTMKRRPLAAAALVATMSVGLAPQALAATNARTTAEVSAPAAVDSARAVKNPETAATYLKQWMFDPNNAHHPLYAKANFNGPASRNTNLKNSMQRKFLQYERQTFGINLGWTHDATAKTAVAVSRWFFTRPDTTHPLRYGDTVAMGYGTSPSYIRYANRTFGINLDWSSAPRYEWKLLGGKTGTQVRSGDWLAIYNTVTKNSETWGQQLGDVTMKFIHDHWREGVAYLLYAVV